MLVCPSVWAFVCGHKKGNHPLTEDTGGNSHFQHTQKRPESDETTGLTHGRQHKNPKKISKGGPEELQAGELHSELTLRAEGSCTIS